MEIDIKDPAEFQHLLNALAIEIVDANVHFKLRSDLIDSISEYQTEYDQSGTFWSLTFQAHLDAAVFRLCKIYEQHNKTLNLRNLLDTIKANIWIFDTEEFRERLKGNPFVESLSEEPRKPDVKQLDKDIAFVSEENSLVKNLLVWRNNYFAHRSVKHIIKKKKLESGFPLTFENVETLLVDGMKILNRYSRLFHAEIYSTNMVGRDDFNNVLRFIREGLEMHEQRIQEEIRKYEQGAS